MAAQIFGAGKKKDDNAGLKYLIAKTVCKKTW
jgi:hypothetical protein